MAERELAIIASARTTLNDVNSTPRWTQKRLMELLSEAQDAMCKGIPLITRPYQLNSAAGQSTYRLPGDSVKLIRASSEGVKLKLVSYDEIEDANPGWEDDVSSGFSAVIVNALDQQEIRPYPMISESKPIKLRYHARPVLLGWDTSTEDSVEELTISPMWDDGLRQYVIGMAFLDYGDEASNSRAATAMGLYQAEFTRAMKLSKKSFAKRVVVTTFQGKVASNFRGGQYGCSNSRFGY